MSEDARAETAEDLAALSIEDLLARGKERTVHEVIDARVSSFFETLNKWLTENVAGLRGIENYLRLCYWESFSGGSIRCCFSSGTIGPRNVAQDTALFNALFGCKIVGRVTMDMVGTGFFTIATEWLDRSGCDEPAEVAGVVAGVASRAKAAGGVSLSLLDDDDDGDDDGGDDDFMSDGCGDDDD